MEFNLGQIQRDLHENALNGATDFLDTYLRNEDRIVAELKIFNGIKTEIYLKEIDKKLDEIIRFSSIFSDITILNHTTSPTKDSHWAWNDPSSKYFRERQITMNTADLGNLHHSFYNFTPIYIYRTNEEVKRLATKFSSLFETNKLLMRPLRGLAARNKLNEQHLFHYVNPNTDNSHWYVDKLDNDALLIDNGLKPNQIIKLFELTLPYFTDINIETLAKILIDETDLLSGFRGSLKQVIRDSGNDQKSLNEIRQDVLNPQIDKINRKFNNIKSVHRLSVAGLVGSFTLSLLIYVYTGSEIAKILAPILPVGGMVAAEINEQNSIDKLKDKDYFLLWRINKGAKNQ